MNQCEVCQSEDNVKPITLEGESEPYGYLCGKCLWNCYKNVKHGSEIIDLINKSRLEKDKI